MENWFIFLQNQQFLQTCAHLLKKSLLRENSSNTKNRRGISNGGLIRVKGRVVLPLFYTKLIGKTFKFKLDNTVFN